jgi:HNH endonuclease
MAECIFCRNTDGTFTTREHILPESLGGGDWAILPSGLFCDSCQNRFGSHIEQQALADYPFSMLRVFLGIPTKKGRAPWIDSWEGILRGHTRPGVVGYDPNNLFAEAVEKGQKTVMRIPAEPRKPQFVCRVLLKMGLEVVAASDPEEAYSSRFDAARVFALTGEKHEHWWYLQHERTDEVVAFMSGHHREEPVIELGTIEMEDGTEVFKLKLFYLQMLVPLEQHIMPPDVTELVERGYRLFLV